MIGNFINAIPVGEPDQSLGAFEAPDVFSFSDDLFKSCNGYERRGDIGYMVRSIEQGVLKFPALVAFDPTGMLVYVLFFCKLL